MSINKLIKQRCSLFPYAFVFIVTRSYFIKYQIVLSQGKGQQNTIKYYLRTFYITILMYGVKILIKCNV